VALIAWTIVLFSAAAFAGLKDPFPAGRSMGDMGTIVWSDGGSGRQPWTPASMLSDTFRFGLAAAAVSYYDRMDNLRDAAIDRVSLGGWVRIAPAFCIVKASYSRLSALGVYCEDEGRVSAATDALPWLRFGFDVAAYRLGLLTEEDASERLLRIGESVWISWSFAAVSISCTHLDIGHAVGRAVDPPTELRLGLHTTRHRFGAQGVVLEVFAEDKPRVNIRVGEEYWFHRSLALSAAVSANPFMVSFGLTVARPSWSIAGALVHHPLLGWSKGCAAEWAR
jgi:hypothetical protein